MAKRKKISRKQLLKEPDEFLTTSAKLIQWAQRHQRKLLYALSALLIVTLAISGFRYHSAQMEKQAFDALSAALAKYQAASGQQNAEIDATAVEKEFDALLQKYGNRAGGHFAGLYFANICYRSGKTDKALTLYLNALKDFEDPFLRAQIQMNIGYAYQKKADFDKAAAYFEAVAADKLSTLAADALFHLSQCLAALGQHDRSARALQQLMDDHADYVYIALIAEQLAGG